MMVDSLSSDQRQWNVTFFSYNSKTMTEEQTFNHGTINKYYKLFNQSKIMILKKFNLFQV